MTNNVYQTFLTMTPVCNCFLFVHCVFLLQHIFILSKSTQIFAGGMERAYPLELEL